VSSSVRHFTVASVLECPTEQHDRIQFVALYKTEFDIVKLSFILHVVVGPRKVEMVHFNTKYIGLRFSKPKILLCRYIPSLIGNPTDGIAVLSALILLTTTLLYDNLKYRYLLPTGNRMLMYQLLMQLSPEYCSPALTYSHD
jgi:hypothetical protein